MVRGLGFALATVLYGSALGCSSDDDEPCGGEDICPAGFSCQDRGDGYRCFPAEVVGDDASSGGSHADSGMSRRDGAVDAPTGGSGGATSGDGSVTATDDAAATSDADITPGPGCRAATILFVIDASGSMCEVFGDSTRWDALRASLIGEPDGLIHRLEDRARLGVHIYDGTIDIFLGSSTSGTPGPACAAAYMEGATTGDCPRLVAVDPAAHNADAISAAYPELLPGGSTPTDKAVTHAIGRLTAVAHDAGVTDEQSTLVLITDGLPNDICFGGSGGDGSAQANAVLDAVEQAQVAGITTHVVSMFGTDAPLDALLTETAQRGSGDPAAEPHRPRDSAELRSALEAIAEAALDCDL